MPTSDELIVPDTPAATEPTAETVRRLTELFARVVRQLGKAGMVEEASRTAGKAYVLLRECAPESAEHINGVMHFLARLPQDDPSRKDTP